MQIARSSLTPPLLLSCVAFATEVSEEEKKDSILFKHFQRILYGVEEEMTCRSL